MLIAPRQSLFFFFFNDTATTEIYTLSLHDALPIYLLDNVLRCDPVIELVPLVRKRQEKTGPCHPQSATGLVLEEKDAFRSEEHTSELQSHLNLVCRLLLEKKKIKTYQHMTYVY